MIWILVAILAVVLIVLLLVMLGKSQNEKAKQKEQMTDSLREDGKSIKNAEPGDFVQIEAISEMSLDYKEIVFEVRHVHKYDCYGDIWYEITGSVGDQPYRLEWYEDDGLHVTGNNQKNALTLNDVGITEDQLAEMDEDGSEENYIDYNGMRYYYSTSDEVLFYKDNGEEGEAFFMWELTSEDKKRLLSVEKWEGEPFELYHSYVLDPAHVSIVKR